MEKYSYEVFQFSHDVTLYPVRFKVDAAMANELGSKYLYQDMESVIKNVFSPPKKQAVSYYSVDNYAHLEDFIGMVFNSERIKRIISAIMQMSA